MDIVKENHAVNVFMDQMNQALHEACLPYYRKRSEYPIDKNVIYWNCVFLTALYLRLNGWQVDRSLVGSLFPEEGSYEAVLWFYQTLGEDPIGRYLEAIGRLVAKVAKDKSGKTSSMSPDLTGLKPRILAENEKIQKFYFYK